MCTTRPQKKSPQMLDWNFVQKTQWKIVSWLHNPMFSSKLYPIYVAKQYWYWGKISIKTHLTVTMPLDVLAGMDSFWISSWLHKCLSGLFFLFHLLKLALHQVIPCIYMESSVGTIRRTSKRSSDTVCESRKTSIGLLNVNIDFENFLKWNNKKFATNVSLKYYLYCQTLTFRDF